jgi:hypothetical protein
MRKLLIGALLLFSAQLGFTQNLRNDSIQVVGKMTSILDFDGYYTVSLDFNKPLSNTDWINSTSAFGLKIGYHRMLNAKFSLGGELNASTYKQYHPTETFYNDDGTGAVTTDYFNYIYAYGAVVSGRYHFTYDKLINPYVGVGLGVAYNKYTRYYNVYGDQNKAFGFLARPEAGMLIRFSQRRAVAGLLGVHYDYSTAKDKTNGYNSFSNLGINVGIVILDW